MRAPPLLLVFFIYIYHNYCYYHLDYDSNNWYLIGWPTVEQAESRGGSGNQPVHAPLIYANRRGCICESLANSNSRQSKHGLRDSKHTNEKLPPPTAFRH